MKKIAFIILTVISVISVTIAKAQDPAVKFGIKGGINYSNLSLDNAENEKYRTGYHVGGFVTLNVLGNIAIQPEVLYSTKGAEVEFKDVLLNGSSVLNLTYVDVPILAVIRLTENINIHGGPYVSVLIDANAKNNSDDELFDFEAEIGNKNFKSTDWGLTGGLGIDVSFFHAGLRYSRGMEKVDKRKSFNGTPYTFSNAMNSMFQLYAGISF